LILKTLPTPGLARGFTLVEMLAAITVLLILTGILFSMMGMAFRVTDSSIRSGDSSTEAREVLDRIGEDVSGMLIQRDVDQSFSNVPGNDEMFFYSQTAGYFDGTSTATQQSPVSLVGYRISTTANASLPPQLERVTQGLTWTGTGGLPFLVFPVYVPGTPANPVTTLPAATAGTIPVAWSSVVTDHDTAPSFWHVIGSQVFRLEICYQLRNGTFTLTPPSPSNPPAVSATVTPGSINDTIGLVVAIAMLDAKSRKIVPTASWPHLIAALPDPTATNLGNTPPQLMDSLWNTAINQSSFAATANLPAAAASQVRVYQRYYPLNAPQAH